MEFLRSFLRRHLARKPVVASRNLSCIIKLELGWVMEQIFWSTLDEFLRCFSLACLTESCSFGYDSKDLFPLPMLRVEVVYDRQN